MIPARALLLSTAILPLALAACETVRKPIRGFDKPPPGSVVLDSDPGGTVIIWPMIDLPDPGVVLRPRLDGQDIVHVTDTEQGFYDYYLWPLQGWTGGWSSWLEGIKPGTHVVELVDGAGQTWGQSAPVPIAAGDSVGAGTGQIPTLVFANFDGKVTSWFIDPTTQDSDMTTDEITVTNMSDADVVVERCLISGGQRSSCTSVGTVAAGADLHTVETMAAADITSKDDHQALVIHPASDASQSYQRNLLQGGADFSYGTSCEVERIVVHPWRQVWNYGVTNGVAVALSSCFGYQGGPPK
jgi:hypothetical protein